MSKLPEIVFEATKVNKIHVYYWCHVCKEQHVHGSCGITVVGHRYGSRSAHCVKKTYHVKDIIVTDKTEGAFALSSENMSGLQGEVAALKSKLDKEEANLRDLRKQLDEIKKNK